MLKPKPECVIVKKKKNEIKGSLFLCGEIDTNFYEIVSVGKCKNPILKPGMMVYGTYGGKRFTHEGEDLIMYPIEELYAYMEAE